MDPLTLLNTDFGNKWVEFASGEGGFPKAIVRSQLGSRAEVYLHGGHITSWQTPNGREQLFCSSSAQFAADKAIRGGVPVIFPQFGPGNSVLGAIQTHGFARNTLWQVVDTQIVEDRPSITLRLESDNATKRIWPHDFQLDIEIFLSDVLEITLTCVNTGTTKFSFQAALHTYFAVPAIDSVAIEGLAGLNYLDNLKARQQSVENAERLTISSEIDRVYLAAPNTLTIHRTPDVANIRIEKWNLPDAVVWNPWVEKSRSIGDLLAEDYKRFVCLECGAIGTPIEVAPKYHYSGGVSFSVV